MSEQIWHECGLCGGRFQYGPHRYEGHFIARYKLVACDGCWHGNAGGWGPAAEPKVLAHLKRNWIAVPERNEKGLLPRDRKSTRLNSSHLVISYAVFCLKKKKTQ